MSVSGHFATSALCELPGVSDQQAVDQEDSRQRENHGLCTDTCATNSTEHEAEACVLQQSSTQPTAAVAPVAAAQTRVLRQKITCRKRIRPDVRSAKTRRGAQKLPVCSVQSPTGTSTSDSSQNAQSPADIAPVPSVPANKRQKVCKQTGQAAAVKTQQPRKQRKTAFKQNDKQANADASDAAQQPSKSRKRAAAGSAAQKKVKGSSDSRTASLLDLPPQPQASQECEHAPGVVLHPSCVQRRVATPSLMSFAWSHL